jgi:signal peptidase I
MRNFPTFFFKCTIYISLIYLTFLLLRFAIFDYYIVIGESMNPSFRNGEKVVVNKLRLGPRIIFRFSNKDNFHIKRLPGLSKLKVGEIVVANYPYPKFEDRISFDKNYVYLKRCYGAPGDTVSIVEGYYKNSNVQGPLGDVTYQRQLSYLKDSVLLEKGIILKSLQQTEPYDWTIRNFGPLYVPRRGDYIKIDSSNYLIWHNIILFETGKSLSSRNGHIFLDNKIIKGYTFNSNWYFLGGDNVLNSKDSRYIGLFPESFIIGIVMRRSPK